MNYRNLSNLIGEEVEILNILPAKVTDTDYYILPDRIVVVNEYPDTLLIRKHFGPRSYLRMISKAALYCGDVRMFHDGRQLAGKAVRA